MLRPALGICLLFASVAGCGRPAAPPPASAATGNPPQGARPAAESGPPAPLAETDLTALLAGLTQAARKYAAEKQRVPKDLEELVAAGYLAAVPPAPAGKRFALDKNLRVVVAGR